MKLPAWIRKVSSENRKLLVVGLLIAFGLAAPYLFTHLSWVPFPEGNAIGDTFAGIAGPFINIAAALLVYWSFREQVKANRVLAEEQERSREREEKSKSQEVRRINRETFLYLSAELDKCTEKGYHLLMANKEFYMKYLLEPSSETASKTKDFLDEFNPILVNYDNILRLILEARNQNELTQSQFNAVYKKAELFDRKSKKEVLFILESVRF